MNPILFIFVFDLATFGNPAMQAPPQASMVTFAIGDDRSSLDHEDDLVLWLHKEGYVTAFDNILPLKSPELAQLVSGTPGDVRLIVLNKSKTSVVQLMTVLSQIQAAAKKKTVVFIKSQETTYKW